MALHPHAHTCTQYRAHTHAHTLTSTYNFSLLCASIHISPISGRFFLVPTPIWAISVCSTTVMLHTLGFVLQIRVVASSAQLLAEFTHKVVPFKQKSQFLQNNKTLKHGRTSGCIQYENILRFS